MTTQTTEEAFDAAVESMLIEGVWVEGDRSGTDDPGGRC